MYKVENCNDKFWCLLDVQTTMPPLLALRWLEAELFEKSLGTQKSYLDSVKLFYDFWLVKHGITLDFSLHKHKYHDIYAFVSELDAFWDYLISDKEITNVARLLTESSIQRDSMRKKRTAAKHCSVVCNFIKFLAKTYISPSYQDEHPLELRKYRSLMNSSLKEAREKFNKYQQSNKNVIDNDIMRSLTPNQYIDFISVLEPDVMKPKKIILPNGAIQIDWQLVRENKLNPINSYEVQMRNYLLTLLLVKYGLRIGESLLLRKSSFKKSETEENQWIMRVRNLNDNKLSDENFEDVRNYKPQIKTASSIRDIYISGRDYKSLMVYYKVIRSQECMHEFIFAASVSPFNPVSYSTVNTQFSTIVKSFKQHFPIHFDKQYAEAILSTITPHWLRHTWAYATMGALHNKLQKQYIQSGIVSIKGLMEDVKDKLRTQGGWSEKSTMPTKYAKRFIQENANITLMEVYNNYKPSDLFYDEYNFILFNE
ncbi:hypothetical protein BEI46_14125 [Aliivibrio fischeri]|uniref:site-specific integrase n=1 Tax=Aliivibrio fischeri TaxID=668 RepID=UPI00084C739B|nr:site-specific integrase [Aliivibrio fischeri]OED54668.1 hypothetical protein BEI46_14125 [Aliivibrio fischeri]